MKLYIKFILVASIATLQLNCSKDRLNEDSPATLTADNLFKTKAGFENALNGLYDEVRRYRSGEPTSSTVYSSINNLLFVQAVIGVDNAYGNYRDPQLDVYNNWGTFNNSSVPQYSVVWAWLYETINAANTIVGRSEDPTIEWTAEEKNNIVAEARCIRAWCYRHLTYLWGDVPLTLEESKGDNIRTDWERTPVAEVRKAMEADWLFAEDNLPETASNDSKLIKGIPQHFLAELYLATGEYDKAKTEALKVINNPNYKLVTARYGVNATKPGSAFTDMFLDGNSKRSQGNTEALWVMQNELNVIGGEGNNSMRRYWVNRYYSFTTGGKSPFLVTAEYGGRGIGRLSPTRFAMNLYSADDDRGSAFAWRHYYLINNPSGIPAGKHLGDTIYMDKTGIEKLSNPNWVSTRKWDYTSPVDVNVDRQYNDQVFLRVAETYLLLAEADFRLHDDQGAADAINALRTRAHTAPIGPADVTIDLILDERSRELFSEEDRRYVLLRTDTWLSRTSQDNKIAGPKITERDKLLPIPQDVIDANITKPFPNNAGY
jgi:starch-binding outer membrane protein, SusD/RagB family